MRNSLYFSQCARNRGSHPAGNFALVLPSENRKDFDELPEYIREGLTVHFVSYFDDVLGLIYPRRR